MPKKSVDLIGRKFGRLVPFKRTKPTKTMQHGYFCICSCGNKCVVDYRNLVSGRQLSCSCLKRESSSKAHRTHGMTKTPIYNIWVQMIKRCSNKNDKNYGGRGISVCKEWEKFERFFFDIGDRPSANHSLGRINNDAGYSKANCRWETKKQQARNKRNTRMLTVNGVTKSQAEWCEIYSLNHTTIIMRLKRGWSESDSVLTPV